MFRLCVSFAVFCVLCCKFSVLSYPQGAPVRTESCINLQPIHMDPLTNQQVPNQQGTTRPYRILVSQQQYQTCTSNQQCGLQPLQGSLLNSVLATSVVIHFILYLRQSYIKEKVVSCILYICIWNKGYLLNSGSVKEVVHVVIFILHQKQFSVKKVVVNFILIQKRW